MIYLIGSIFLSTSLFVTFKLFKRFGIDNVQAIASNYLVGAVFGYSIYGRNYDFTTMHTEPWFVSAVILGILFISVFYLFAISSQKAGVALTAVASKMSVVIPVVFGILLYTESVSLLKIIGIVAALLAFYLTFKNNIQFVTYSSFVLLPVFLFLGNGAVDTLIKYAEHHYVADDIGLFLSTIFIVAFFIGVIITIVKVSVYSDKLRFRNFLGGSILGMLNFATTYFVILALALLESSVLFPVLNAGIVSLSAIIGYMFFKEKLSTVNAIGIVLAVIAIFMISLA